MRHQNRLSLLILIVILFYNIDFSYGKTIKLKTESIIARYDSEVEKYALASIKVLELVREKAIESGFDLPDKIKFEIKRTDRNVLWVDKKSLNKITWEYTSLDNFLPPSKSKKKNVYGLCHEIGHLCMYRTFYKNNLYLSYNYRESWADYFGNLMIDSVYHKLGTDIWPEPHNYTKTSGMTFLRNRISNNNPNLKEFNACSQFWIELSDKIGFANYNDFFNHITSTMRTLDDKKSGYAIIISKYIDEENIDDWFNKYADYVIRIEK